MLLKTSTAESTESLSTDIVASVSVQVSNIGHRSGDEVVLLFVSPPQATIAHGAPLQHLAAFERVAVLSGETETISLHLDARDLALQTLHPASDLSRQAWHLRTNNDYHQRLPFVLQNLDA